MVAAEGRELSQSRMRLSVIVPTLDGSVPKSLRTAVAGRTDVEVVVVKGVSPVGKARNEGLRRATGDYVAWVDADDEVTEDWLPSILKATEADPDLITFDATRIGWENGDSGIVWGEAAPTVEKLVRSVYQDLERMCAMWLFVTKRKLWEDLHFDESAVICEDYLVLPHLVSRAKTLAYVPRQTYRYVCNGESLVHRYGFTGEARVMELKRCRSEEAPPAYRSAAALGLATAYYGVAIRVAHGFAVVKGEGWRREAQMAREYIRRNFRRIVVECLGRTRLPLCEKLKWVLRFVWNCLPEGLARRLVRRD